MWCFQYPLFFHLIRLATVNQPFSYGFWHETIVWEKKQLFYVLICLPVTFDIDYLIFTKKKRGQGLERGGKTEKERNRLMS